MNQNCPQRQELVDYLLGKLPEDLLQQLEQHFVDCSSCEETLRGLNVADTLNNWVEQAARDAVATRPSEDSEEQFVANLISRMQDQSSAHSQLDPLTRERAAEVIRLLEIDDADECLGRLGQYKLQSLIGAGS